MELEDIKQKIPEQVFEIMKKEGISKLRPAQTKSIKAGLFKDKNLLVCTPTASGKTLIAELAILKTVIEKGRKAVYIVPLKALATEKYREFKRKYEGIAKVALSIGDLDSSNPYLANYDIIITVSEKLDSLIRHHCSWLSSVSVIVIDEIHLLNDIGRGPTLEILITILMQQLKAQIIALSATIGNPKELAEWLNAKLIIDDWRPVELKKGLYLDGEVELY